MSGSQREERMLFIGVSSTGSSIFELFPRWAEILGIQASIEGHDIPLAAPPSAFRAAVKEIAGDPGLRGALVTTHKVDVYRHAGELFDELEPNARLCREVSCISKRDGALVGHAKDPITAGRALEEFLPPDHWASGAQVLCLGAGGAGTAITVQLIRSDPAPEVLVVGDVDAGRLQRLAAVIGAIRTSTIVRLEHVGSVDATDALLDRLPPGSLVVNATGLGKDAPGSPISDGAVFPERALVWELNYRGDLRFLEQARRQAIARGLAIHDGWRYFLIGWSEAIAEVFDLTLTPQRFERLAGVAPGPRPHG